MAYQPQRSPGQNVQQLTCPQPHPPISQGEVDSFLQRMLDKLKLEVTQWCDQLTNEASSAKSRGDYDISKLQRENAQLKTKVSQQEHTIQEYKSDLELITEEAFSEHNDLKSRIRYLEDEIKKRDTSLQTKEKELEEYRQRPDNPQSFVGGVGGGTAAKRRLNDEIGKNKELTKEISLLKDQLASAVSSEEIASIEREKNKVINEKDREVRQLKREKENLQRELDETRAEEREEYEQQLASARDEYTHLEAEKRQALDQLQNEKERYHELSVELKLEHARKQLQHMTDSSVNDSEMDDYIQEISIEITGLSEDIAKKREEIKHQQAQITQLTKERDEAVTKITSLQEELKTKQEEFKRKELQIREENQRKIKEYIDDAEQWRIQYETAKEELSKVTSARKQLQHMKDSSVNDNSEMEAYIQKNKELTKEVTSLKDQLASAVSREEIASIEREKNKLINDKDREVRQLKREKENLQRELDESRAEEQEEYEQQLASAKDEYTHLEAEKRQALDQLQNEKERYHELSVEQSKVKSELEQARKQLQHMKDSSVNDNSEMDTYMQEMITGLTEDIARKREEIKHQQAQIKQLTKERDEAVTKIMSIQEEFKRNKPHRLKKTS